MCQVAQITPTRKCRDSAGIPSAASLGSRYPRHANSSLAAYRKIAGALVRKAVIKRLVASVPNWTWPRIAPLASRGIIAQITSKAVIYDAETTVGGSGGPALDRNGQVIAVNAAILPEFGGANIGVPVREVHRLLADFAAN